MPKKKEITGNDIAKLMEVNEISVNCMAWFLGVDRNTVGSYKRKKNKPLPRQNQLKILIDHLKSNVEQVKADFEEAKQ